MEVHPEPQSVTADPKSGYPSFSQTISISNVIEPLRGSTIKTSKKNIHISKNEDWYHLN